MKNDEKAMSLTNIGWCLTRMISPSHDFNEAIRLAESNGFQVAYSNQAFEYWFLLHFNIYRGYIHRNDYEQMLSQQMKVKYSKKGISRTKYMDYCCHISRKPYQASKK